MKSSSLVKTHSMRYLSKFKKIAGLSTAATINVFLLSLLSLILAKILTVEEFGVTRSITAYMVVLTMFGHMTFHDALATMLAKEKNKDKQVGYFSTASWFVFANSLGLAIVSYVILKNTDYWQGLLGETLQYFVFCLPFATLAILYNTSLQVVGGTRTMAVVQLVNGLVPFVIIIPITYLAGMFGWLVSRATAFLMLAGFSLYLVRDYIKVFGFEWCLFVKMFNFSRVQIFSGLASLVLLSADIILLERLTGDMTVVAQYGLAAFFGKATLVVPSSIGRIYFRELANENTLLGKKRAMEQFLSMVFFVCLAIAVFLYFCGPLLISAIYGDEYKEAASILRYLCVGIVFMGLWHAISTINIATANPGRSVKVALVGSIIGVTLLFALVPTYGGNGAAWAMNIAYASGVFMGFLMIFPKHEAVE